jgi:hypothetical protein
VQFGQLGLGDDRDRNAPTLVATLDGRHAVLVACGWRHTVVTTADGAMWSWGRGTNYQLGHGEEADLLEPRRIDPAALAAAAKAAAPAGSAGSGDPAAAAHAPLVTPADRFAVVPEEGAAGGGGGAHDGAGGGSTAARKKPRLDESDAAVPGC